MVGEKETLAAVEGTSIILATGGPAKLKANGKTWDISKGNVFFVAQDTEIALESMNGLAMYTVYVE